MADRSNVGLPRFASEHLLRQNHEWLPAAVHVFGNPCKLVSRFHGRKGCGRLYFDQDDATVNQPDFKVRCVPANAIAIRIGNLCWLLAVAFYRRRGFKEVDGVELKESFMVNHAAVLAARELASHDAPGRTDYLA